MFVDVGVIALNVCSHYKRKLLTVYSVVSRLHGTFSAAMAFKVRTAFMAR